MPWQHCIGQCFFGSLLLEENRPQKDYRAQLGEREEPVTSPSLVGNSSQIRGYGCSTMTPVPQSNEKHDKKGIVYSLDQDH